MTSRFTVVDAPTKAPAVDYITGSAVGPFIDTNRNIQDPAGRILGRIYLSKDTVAEMARELGLVGSHADRAALEEAYLRGKLDSLREDLSGDLIAVADTLRRWLAYIELPGDTDLAAAQGK